MKNAPAPTPERSLHHVLTLVQLAGVAALIFWVVLLKRDLGAAEQELASLRQRSTPSGKTDAENKVLRARVTALESQASVRAIAATSPAPTTAVAAPPTPPSPMAALAASMNNPAMRALMATTQKRMLETRFAELFTQLQFSTEQRARFIELMSEGQSAMTDAGLKLASGNLSAAEQGELRQQVKEAGEATDAKIREFLGDDAQFATYKQYVDQQAERTQVNALKTSLAQSGQSPLSAEQSAALTSIMYAERKGFPFTPNPSADPATPMFTAMSAATMETRLREQELLQNRIAERASAVLGPEQLAGLRQSQAVSLQALQASLEMARQMSGGPSPASK